MFGLGSIRIKVTKTTTNHHEHKDLSKHYNNAIFLVPIVSSLCSL